MNETITPFKRNGVHYQPFEMAHDSRTEGRANFIRRLTPPPRIEVPDMPSIVKQRAQQIAETKANLVAYVKTHPGECLIEIAVAIDHHYDQAYKAQNYFSEWLRAGEIEGVRFEKDGRFIRVYPVDEL